MGTRCELKQIVCAVVLSFACVSAANAGAFSLYTEGSASAVGIYAAGAAAEAADATTGWYNPAGLPLLKEQQLIVSGVNVSPSTQISGISTFSSIGFDPYIQRFDDLQGAKNGFVPALHYVLPLGERVAFGLSAVVPFGLSTEYSPTSAVRYSATYTELMTTDVSPELGVQLTDHFSLGGGVNFEWAKVKFNRVLGNPTLLQYGGFSPMTFDSLSYNSGHSTGVGFHAGVMGLFNQNHTRLGLNYQSAVQHEFHGFSRLTGPFASPLFDEPQAVVENDNLYSNSISFPKIITLSAYHDLTERLALLGSIVYTGWDVFDVTTLNNVAALSDATVNSTAIQNYRNAWRYAAGANYHLTSQWMLRAGGGYDQTPTVDSARDARLPDANRYALSVGAHYQMLPSLGFDAGYTYLWAAQNPKLNKTELLGELGENNIRASADVHAHLVGLQAVWTIDGEAKEK